MLDAYTAYENAMEILNMNMKTEIDYVLDEIKTASDEGEFDIMWFSPYPKTIKKLKQLGYKVKCSHGFYEISWRKPKEVKNNEII